MNENLSVVDKEEIWSLHLSGISNYGIMIRYGLTRKQVEHILNPLKKDSLEYNQNHVNEKYGINRIVYESTQPKTILDLFAGKYRFWKTEYSDKSLVLDNDIEKSFGTIFNEDSETLVKRLEENDVFFDLIDVDPFGCPEPFLKYAVSHARKGVIITDGCAWSAVHFHKNPVRKDYFKKVYNTNTENRMGSCQDIIDYVHSLRPDFNFEIYKDWHCCWRAWIYKKED